MENRKYNYSEYVQGSAVRKLNTAPDRRENAPRPQRQAGKKTRQAKKRQAQNIDVFSVIFMTGAIMAAVYMCVTYVQVQHNITTMSKQAVILESKIVDLKNLNDAAYNRINTSVDLSYVYEVAVNELGMVRADQRQIKTYNNIKSDYVRQYGEIPEGKKPVLERILTKDKE